MGFIPAGADILPPSDDRIFKLLLTEESMKPALIHLLSALLDRKVVDVTLYPNEPPKDDIHEKGERLDVNCKIEDGSQINLEMAASRIEEDPDGQHQNLKGKSVYYATDLHASQPAKGQMRYDRLARTYQITFCTYTIFPENQAYVNSFFLRNDKTGEQLTDALHITFVELSKLGEIAQKPVEEMTDLEKWSVFFRYAPDKNHRDMVNKVIASEEVFRMAGEKLMTISQNEAERAWYRSRRKFETDMLSNMTTARDNGRREGEQIGEARGRREGEQIGEVRGRREEKIEIARSALQNKMPSDLVAQITGLTLEEVKQLQGESLPC